MELPNRDTLEADFAKRFGKLARKHLREFRRLLGDPPDLANVPEAFWQKMQRETDSELYAILLLIFDESALFHGWDTPLTGIAAYGWAKQRAEDFSKYWVESTQERLSKGFEKLQQREQPDESTVEAAREFNRLGGTETVNRVFPGEQPVRNPTKKEIDEILNDTFGPKRIETNAIDETTRARHAGGESAIEETVGVSEDDLWKVNPPRICPICMSLDGKRRADWPWRYRSGPPIHPHCKCEISYSNVSLPEAIGRMLDDPDYKSLKAFDPNEKRGEDGKWTLDAARERLHNAADEMGTHLTPSASHIVISHPETRTVRSGLWGAVSDAGNGGDRDEYSIKPDPDEPSASNLYWTHYSNGKGSEPQMMDSFETVDEAKNALKERMQQSIEERTGIHPLTAHEKRTGELSKWEQEPTKFGKEFRPADESLYTDLDDYIGPDYGGMSLADLPKNARKSMPHFNLKSWFRQIPNAAEWRAYARENEIGIDDRTAFKSFDESKHPRGEHGQWTSEDASGYVAHQAVLRHAIESTEGFQKFREFGKKFHEANKKEDRKAIFEEAKRSLTDHYRSVAENALKDNPSLQRKESTVRNMGKRISQSLLDDIRDTHPDEDTFTASAVDHAFYKASNNFVGSLAQDDNSPEHRALQRAFLGTERHPRYTELNNTPISEMSPHQKIAFMDGGVALNGIPRKPLPVRQSS